MIYIGWCAGCDHLWKVKTTEAECPKCGSELEIQSVHT